jgi:hypothetical protein
MSNQPDLRILQCPDDTLERRGDIGEISDTTSNDKDFAVGAGCGASDKVH